MKRKIMLSLTVIALVLSFSVGTSLGAETWYFGVNPVKAAASSAGVSVTVANDAGTWSLGPILLSSSIEKIGLAVILTAQSMSQKIHVLHDDSANEWIAVTLSTE